jgi:hypothetical protein
MPELSNLLLIKNSSRASATGSGLLLELNFLLGKKALTIARFVGLGLQQFFEPVDIGLDDLCTASSHPAAIGRY